jgi:hypothetical protein
MGPSAIIVGAHKCISNKNNYDKKVYREPKSHMEKLFVGHLNYTSLINVLGLPKIQL